MSSKGAAVDAIPTANDVLVGSLQAKDWFVVDATNPLVKVDPADKTKAVLSDDGKLLLKTIKRGKQWPALTITIGVLAGVIVIGGIIMFVRRNNKAR